MGKGWAIYVKIFPPKCIATNPKAGNNFTKKINPFKKNSTYTPPTIPWRGAGALGKSALSPHMTSNHPAENK
jgi:hypothetical protein